jgi:hypothetical protein
VRNRSWTTTKQVSVPRIFRIRSDSGIDTAGLVAEIHSRLIDASST